MVAYPSLVSLAKLLWRTRLLKSSFGNPPQIIIACVGYSVVARGMENWNQSRAPGPVPHKPKNLGAFPIARTKGPFD